MPQKRNTPRDGLPADARRLLPAWTSRPEQCRGGNVIHKSLAISLYPLVLLFLLSRNHGVTMLGPRTRMIEA